MSIKYLYLVCNTRWYNLNIVEGSLLQLKMIILFSHFITCHAHNGHDQLVSQVEIILWHL